MACGVLRRLWIPSEPAHPFETAHARAVGQCEDVVRRYRRVGQAIRRRALRTPPCAAFEQLAAYDGECVVLHQDFHRANVLRAQREPWLAIDPKPLAGERAFNRRSGSCATSSTPNRAARCPPRSCWIGSPQSSRSTQSASGCGRSPAPSRARSGATRSTTSPRTATCRWPRPHCLAWDRGDLRSAVAVLGDLRGALAVGLGARRRRRAEAVDHAVVHAERRGDQHGELGVGVAWRRLSSARSTSARATARGLRWTPRAISTSAAIFGESPSDRAELDAVDEGGDAGGAVASRAAPRRTRRASPCSRSSRCRQTRRWP